MIKDLLASNAGRDPIQDSQYVGYLKAVNDLFNVEFVDEQGDEHEV